MGAWFASQGCHLDGHCPEVWEDLGGGDAAWVRSVDTPTDATRIASEHNAGNLLSHRRTP